jgi:hypothetical protein
MNESAAAAMHWIKHKHDDNKMDIIFLDVRDCSCILFHVCCWRIFAVIKTDASDGSAVALVLFLSQLFLNLAQHRQIDQAI